MSFQQKMESFQGNIVNWVGMNINQLGITNYLYAIMKQKVKPGLYSNRFEQFRIDATDKEEVMNFHAITDIGYFPLKRGNTISLNRGTIESIINDEELGFKRIK